MTAFRWILLALVTFGAGTGVAFAMHPPSPGLPTATAQALAADLTAIEQYADEGRCDAVRGRLDGAQSKISKLPSSTSEELVNQLQRSLQHVSRAARAQCQTVFDAEAADRRKKAEEARKKAEEEAAQATTPTTPVEPTEPTTPDPGADEGGPDPGTGEGEGDTGGGITTPGAPDTQDPSGGVVPGVDEAQGELERKLEKERQKWEDRLRKIQERWGQ